VSLNEHFLGFLGNPAATDGGSPCSGDSGAPYLFGTSRLSIGVESFEEGRCNAISGGSRLDTRTARAFLDDYVELP
jgi:hypothetical protein